MDKNYKATNPKEFFTTFSGKSLLALENHLTPITKDSKNPPQCFYDETFSKFLFTVISDGTAKTANVPLSDLADIYERTSFVKNKIYEREFNPSELDHNEKSETELSPAYRVRFLTGEFKGKTPAEVLLENPNNKEKMNNQYKMLKEHLSDYPNNQLIMDAIIDAANLLNDGKLVKVISSDLAYTIKFVVGEFKGCSPAEVLLKNPQKKDALLSNKEFLSKNVEKFPNNRKLMDAIDQAVELLEKGMLNIKDGEMPSNNVFNIYKPGMRPLIRKRYTKNENLSFVYEIEIKCNIDNKYPIEITVVNYYAPVRQKENGLINVIASEKAEETYSKGTINVSLAVWNDIISRMKTQQRVFEVGYGPALMRTANEIFMENVKKSKENNNP